MGFGYVLDGYWDDGYATEYQVAPLPSIAMPPTQTTLLSYEYLQYNDDKDIAAFFDAYNNFSENYLIEINDLNLPIYSQQFGAMLDWVAFALYGYTRPILSYGSVKINGGAYNENPYNTINYNSTVVSGSSGLITVTDDIFQRCLLWNLYTGDGKQFNLVWLKNRVMRFLTMINGIPTPMDNTYIVSVTFSTGNNVLISIDPSFVSASALNSATAQALQAAINEQVLQLPFQYNFSVVY